MKHPLIIASFFVAGVKFANPDLSIPKQGDDVILEPDPKNQYDPNAIRLNSSGQFLGHVPREATCSIHHAIKLGLTPQAWIIDNIITAPDYKRLLVQVQVEVEL